MFRSKVRDLGARRNQVCKGWQKGLRYFATGLGFAAGLGSKFYRVDLQRYGWARPLPFGNNSLEPYKHQSKAQATNSGNPKLDSSVNP